jgi:hypothetical protein
LLEFEHHGYKRAAFLFTRYNGFLIDGFKQHSCVGGVLKGKKERHYQRFEDDESWDAVRKLLFWSKSNLRMQLVVYAQDHHKDFFTPVKTAF